MAEFDPAEYGSQLLGIDRNLIIAQRLQKAMDDPKAYFKERQVTLKALQDQARTTFLGKYKAYKALGLPLGQCKTKAEDITNKLIGVLFDEFNAEYPANITDLSVDKLMKDASHTVGADLK